MNKMTVADIAVSGKRVLLRVDYNVPLDEATGAITDDSRIRATLPTIKYLIEHSAKVIIISHLGRPKGVVVDALRLAPVAQRLAKVLGQPVGMAQDCIGPEVQKAVEYLRDGEVLLLDNLRFHPEEESGKDEFAQSLASLADIFVNDAFGASHRAHASIVGVADYLPAVAGFLLDKEIKTLGGLLESPAHPFANLLGGAKISDKVGLLQNIMDKVDYILVGGGMAATFLKAQGYGIGSSLVEDDKLDLVLKIEQDAQQNGVEVLLPVDVMVADEINAEAQVQIVPIDSISPPWRIVDIGPRTVDNFATTLQGCQTVFWNGPMGIFEITRFAEGTRRLAEVLSGTSATTIIGGGSTAEAVAEMGLADRMTFVSTGGGASLEFLGSATLPGVEVLLNKGSRVD
ncbi:MAG: phosphoglycerate kinase [Chloroflexota bacterium]